MSKSIKVDKLGQETGVKSKLKKQATIGGEKTHYITRSHTRKSSLAEGDNYTSRSINNSVQQFLPDNNNGSY